MLWFRNAFRRIVWTRLEVALDFTAIFSTLFSPGFSLIAWMAPAWHLKRGGTNMSAWSRGVGTHSIWFDSVLENIELQNTPVKFFFFHSVTRQVVLCNTYTTHASRPFSLVQISRNYSPSSPFCPSSSCSCSSSASSLPENKWRVRQIFIEKNTISNGELLRWSSEVGTNIIPRF